MSNGNNINNENPVTDQLLWLDFLMFFKTLKVKTSWKERKYKKKKSWEKSKK